MYGSTIDLEPHMGVDILDFTLLNIQNKIQSFTQLLLVGYLRRDFIRIERSYIIISWQSAGLQPILHATSFILPCIPRVSEQLSRLTPYCLTISIFIDETFNPRI